MTRVLWVALLAACSGKTVPADDAGLPDSAVPDAGLDAAPDAASDPADAGPREGPDYALVFDPEDVAIYHLVFTRADWEALQDDWTREVPATVRYRDEEYEDVGVRYKGNVSLEYGGDKKSFKLDFDEFVPEGRFHGLETINLHNGFKDPTLLRETLAYELHRAAGDLASRTSHARVHVTVPGLYDDEYFGLYVNVEEVDARYLRDRLGDSEGTLYKDGDFRWYGYDPATYVPDVYEPRTNRTSDDHAALVHFLDVLDNTPTPELEHALDQVFDVDRFLGWLAANTLLSNMDGIPGGGGNCFLYQDVTQGKMVLIPWDMNEAFGSTSEGLSVEELLTLDVHEPVVFVGASPLIERVLSVPAFSDRYDQILEALLAGDFSVAAMHARIGVLRERIRPFVEADTRRDYTIEQFDRSFEEDVPGLPNPPYPEGNVVIGLERFVRARVQSVQEQLSGPSH